jgi:hypothetical protein
MHVAQLCKSTSTVVHNDSLTRVIRIRNLGPIEYLSCMIQVKVRVIDSIFLMLIYYDCVFVSLVILSFFYNYCKSSQQR